MDPHARRRGLIAGLRPVAPMHIAINGWFAGQLQAGSGQYLHHLLDHIPRQNPGVRLSLLVPEPRPAAAQPPAWSGVQTLAVATPGLPKNLRKLWWEQVTVPRAAQRLRADVLWAPYWAAPLWQPLPVCVTVHDLIPRLLPAYRGSALHRLYTALVSRSARRAAAVLTVSHASAADIVQHLRIAPARVHVVYHGADAGAPPDRATRDAVAAKYALPPRYFLYLGGFDVRKNLGAVFAAYQRYLARGGDPAVRLVVGGKLPDAATAVLQDPRQLAADHGLQGQVHWCGWIDEADKPTLYARATAFLFPSLYEGFGMPVIEAMAAGTPVITSAAISGDCRP